jgi:hypothetical protein
LIGQAVTRHIETHDTDRSKRERERDLYFSVVTGTHYGTKTPPDQQPACHAQGYDKTDVYLQYVSSMVSRVRCQV